MSSRAVVENSIGGSGVGSGVLTIVSDKSEVPQRFFKRKAASTFTVRLVRSIRASQLHPDVKE